MNKERQNLVQKINQYFFLLLFKKQRRLQNLSE